MKKLLAVVALAAGMSSAADVLLAHHSRGGTYDMKKQVTLKGTVTEVSWRNPHVAIYIDVKDPDGKVVNWAFENSSVSTLARQGTAAIPCASARRSPPSSIPARSARQEGLS